MESNSTAILIKIKLRHSLGRPSHSDFVQSRFIEVTKMMPTIGLMTIVFAALTIYLCHDEYKNGKMSSKNFKIVAICEGFAILGMIFLIITW